MINCVILTGRLTKKPEIVVTSNGEKRTGFTLAVDNGKDRPADFIRCNAFKKTAETICAYCNKGDLIGVEGRISTYTKGEGENRETITSVLVNTFHFMPNGSKNTETKLDKPLTVSADDLPF